MKVIKFKNEEEWLEARKGKITGTKVLGLINKRSKKPKIGFYQLIAERIALPPTPENVLDRGKKLEEVALEKFAKKTKKKVETELVIWQREDIPDIAISPDGWMDGGKEAVEVKCLDSARHLEAYLTKEVPSEYEYQVLQYFIVNENLKKLYLVFYDPRMPKELFWIVVERKGVEEKIREVLEIEKEALEKIRKIEDQLTFPEGK